MRAKSLQPCLFATPWTVAHPGSSVLGILQARTLAGAAISSSGDLPDPGMEAPSPRSAALAGRFFATSAPGKPGGGCYFELAFLRWGHTKCACVLWPEARGSSACVREEGDTSRAFGVISHRGPWPGHRRHPPLTERLRSLVQAFSGVKSGPLTALFLWGAGKAWWDQMTNYRVFTRPPVKHRARGLQVSFSLRMRKGNVFLTEELFCGEDCGDCGFLALGPLYS